MPDPKALFLWPVWSDVGVLYTPTAAGGAWPAALPFDNTQDRELAAVARSLSARPEDTRRRIDLKTDRAVRGLAIPAHNFSTAAKWRAIGVPSSMLFDYEAGDDISALGGTHTRAPTAGALAATYVDHNGLVQYAGENRWIQSENLNDAANTLTNGSLSLNSIASPFGAVTADTLTATSGNATLKQGITTVALTYTFSGWLKRKTGSGNIDITMDGTTWVTKAVTDDWQRFSVSQTGVAGTSNPGIRVVANTDAVYAWGMQVEIGSVATSYLATTAAARGALRDSHYPVIGGARTTLLEPAHTNLCLQSEDLGTTWATVGSPTRSAAAGTCGVVNLDLIGDDDAAALEGYTQTITYTGDAVKSVSLFIRQGTSTSTVIRLRDTSAGADRLLAAITWSGGLPVITMTTGTSLGYQTLADASGNAVFRVRFQTTSVTAANTNSLQIYPATDAALATASTGTVYVGGFSTADALVPTSYVKTATATVARAADALSFTWSGGNPQASSFYVDYYAQGAGQIIGTATRVLHLGAANANNPSFALVQDNSNGRDAVTHNNNVDTAVTSTSAAAATYGQRIELLGTLASTGAVQISRAVNGGSFTAASASSAPASGLAAAWAGSVVLTIGARGDGTSHAPIAVKSVRIVAGVQTGAYMQTVVSDSGWLDAWPSGLDAEESEGMNVPAVHLLSTAFSARYWSLQIRDPLNAAGYIDLARLVIGGGFEPSITFSYGAEFSVETNSVRERMASGVAHYEEQPRFRRFTCSFDHLTEAESMQVLEFVRRVGIHGQFFFVWDKYDTTYLYARSFLATLQQTSRLRAAYLLNAAAAFDIVEEL